MDAVAHQGRDLVESNIPGSNGQVAAGVHRNNAADLSSLDCLAGQRVTWVEPADVAHHELAGSGFCRIQDFQALARIGRHRFFQQHVLACSQGCYRDLVMLFPVRHDADHVDLVIIEQLPVVGLCPLDPECCRPFCQGTGLP